MPKCNTVLQSENDFIQPKIQTNSHGNCEFLALIRTKKFSECFGHCPVKGNNINGYIQSLSRQPIVIHMYCEDQILLLKHFNWGEITLHLDATGSVVRKLIKNKRDFFTMRSLSNSKNKSNSNCGNVNQ